jgi:outer membrane lipase/esterase
MHVSWLRRALLAAACLSAVVVAACGGGTVVSQFTPTRLVSFGDAFSDLGQRGTRYTINDSAVQLEQPAGGALRPGARRPAPAGLAFATGNARINTVPDAAGDATTLTIAQQVDAFLATQSFRPATWCWSTAAPATSWCRRKPRGPARLTDAQALAATRQAATDLAALVKRIVDSGAQHVGVVGTYDLGRSPYAAQTGQAARLSTLSSEFNIKLKTELFGYNIADRVLYVDAEYYYNLVISEPQQPDLRQHHQRDRPGLQFRRPGTRHRHRRGRGELRAVHRLHHHRRHHAGHHAVRRPPVLHAGGQLAVRRLRVRPLRSRW